MNQADPIALDFLRSHRLGALATGGRNGAPQQTIIAYNFDGEDIVISTGADSVKTRNLRRRPLASLLVSDGPKAVVVFGPTRIATGDEAEQLRLTRLQPPRPAGEVPARTAPRPQVAERVTIILKPERIRSNRLDG